MIYSRGQSSLAGTTNIGIKRIYSHDILIARKPEVTDHLAHLAVSAIMSI